MATPTSRHALRAYTRAVGVATLQAAATGAWIAAGELPTTRRRLARAGLATAIAAQGILEGSAGSGTAARRAPAERDPSPASPLAGTATGKPGHRFAVVALVSLSVALTVGSRRLQRQWLARLARGGHPHPHRALGARLAALSFVGTLPAELLRAHETEHARATDAPH